jgi:hypothetical protein
MNDVLKGLELDGPDKVLCFWIGTKLEYSADNLVLSSREGGPSRVVGAELCLKLRGPLRCSE